MRREREREKDEMKEENIKKRKGIERRSIDQLLLCCSYIDVNDAS
jgi:hypothetical protein